MFLYLNVNALQTYKIIIRRNIHLKEYFLSCIPYRSQVRNGLRLILMTAKKVKRNVVVCASSRAAKCVRSRRHGFGLIVVLLACIALTLSSCNTKQQAKSGPAHQVTAATGIRPGKDTLKPPHVTLLDTCAKPLYVAIPTGERTMMLQRGKETEQLLLKAPECKPAGFQAHITTYSSDQGLYGLISNVMRDSKGNMWFGTDGGGVIKYDGHMFITYTTAHGLGSNTVHSIAEDSKGKIWMGTDGGGASCYNGYSFTNYTTRDGLPSNNVWCMSADGKGNIWMGTDAGACRFDGKKFITYTTAQGLPHNTVRCITADSKGNVWLGTEGGGASRYDGTSFTTINKDAGLPANDIRSILPDNTGKIWFGTYEKGVSCYDGRTFTNYTTAQGICHNTVSCMAQDRQGNIWMGTSGGGVSCYNGQTFTTYSVAQGLGNNTVLSVAADKEGDLWFGTYGGGASLYYGSAFTTYTTAQGLGNNQILSIAEDNSGSLWFGAAVGGINRYDGRSFTDFSTAQGLPNSQAVNITKDKSGRLWIGTYGGGMSCYDGKGFTCYTSAQGLGNNNIMCSVTDSAGRLWIGMDGGGISCLDGKTMTTYTTAQGLCNNSVLSIAIDHNGKLWAGTNGGGVSLMDGSGFTTYTTAQGLCNNKIYCITTDKAGNVWFGSDGSGVSRFDGRSFLTYSTAQGLCNNIIFGVATDATGNVWLGTNEGLCALKGYTKTTADNAQNTAATALTPPSSTLTNEQLDKEYSPVFETYSFKKSFPVKDVNENALFIDSKGVIWAGTGDKLVRFDPAAITTTRDSPMVFLSSVKIDNENISWNGLRVANSDHPDKISPADSLAIAGEEVNTFGTVLSEAGRDTMVSRFGNISFSGIGSFYPIPRDLSLPYSHNNVTFEFGAVEVARPHLMRYQYMLEGYDKDWSPVSHKTSATFGNIKEGTYTLRLKAQGPDGIWSTPLSYTFTVEPPVYRTWLAYLSYLISAVTIIIVIIRTRTSQLRREKDKLERTVEERTAQIAQEKAEAERQKQRSEDLLLNILPEEVATELKETGMAKAKYFDNVTVLLTDFVNFTRASEQLTPQELIDEIHACFKVFDEIVTRYGIEKIKTIGDAYLAVCGLPHEDPLHAEKIVNAAREIRDFMAERSKALGTKTFAVRIGIHTGNAIAGIVGVKKFAYDIWGDTVNTTARMEQNCDPGKVNISEATYEIVKDKFNCTYRGEIEAKNKGKMKMYFVD
jgi:ligand-binding sensor domain-containing protein/class 3 adenylate cyclase